MKYTLAASMTAAHQLWHNFIQLIQSAPLFQIYASNYFRRKDNTKTIPEEEIDELCADDKYILPMMAYRSQCTDGWCN